MTTPEVTSTSIDSDGSLGVPGDGLERHALELGVAASGRVQEPDLQLVLHVVDAVHLARGPHRREAFRERVHGTAQRDHVVIRADGNLFGVLEARV